MGLFWRYHRYGSWITGYFYIRSATQSRKWNDFAILLCLGAVSMNQTISFRSFYSPASQCGQNDFVLVRSVLSQNMSVWLSLTKLKFCQFTTKVYSHLLRLEVKGSWLSKGNYNYQHYTRILYSIARFNWLIIITWYWTKIPFSWLCNENY